MEKRYFLKPGYIFFSKEGHILETVLGSCISLCLFDPENKMGVMTHYIYATYREEDEKGYTGSIALPFALKTMLDNGSKLDKLKAHIVGGGKNPRLTDKVGKENSGFAIDFINKQKIPLLTLDVGEEKSRRVIFNTTTGELQVKSIDIIRKWFYDG